MSGKYLDEILMEADDLLRESYIRTKKLLSENKNKILSLANVLVEKEIMNFEEVRNHFRGFDNFIDN